MRMTLVLGALMAGLVAACNDTTAPPAFAGRYSLAAVDGATVPTALNPDVQIQSGWLHLDPGGDWMLSRTQHADATTVPPSVDTLSGRWAASGNDITLYFASTSVVQARATFASPTVVVIYASQHYTFVPN
jgi:hypothetical protein